MAGLFNKTQEEYYQQSQTFEAVADAAQAYELLNTFFPTVPAAKADIRVFVDGAELDVDDYVEFYAANTNDSSYSISSISFVTIEKINQELVMPKGIGYGSGKKKKGKGKKRK